MAGDSWSRKAPEEDVADEDREKSPTAEEISVDAALPSGVETAASHS